MQTVLQEDQIAAAEPPPAFCGATTPQKRGPAETRVKAATSTLPLVVLVKLPHYYHAPIVNEQQQINQMCPWEQCRQVRPVAPALEKEAFQSWQNTLCLCSKTTTTSEKPEKVASDSLPCSLPVTWTPIYQDPVISSAFLI